MSFLLNVNCIPHHVQAFLIRLYRPLSKSFSLAGRYNNSFNYTTRTSSTASSSLSFPHPSACTFFIQTDRQFSFAPSRALLHGPTATTTTCPLFLSCTSSIQSFFSFAPHLALFTLGPAILLILIQITTTILSSHLTRSIHSRAHITIAQPQTRPNISIA